MSAESEILFSFVCAAVLICFAFWIGTKAKRMTQAIRRKFLEHIDTMER